MTKAVPRLKRAGGPLFSSGIPILPLHQDNLLAAKRDAVLQYLMDASYPKICLIIFFINLVTCFLCF